MDRRAININRLLMVLICGLFSLNHRVCADDGLQKPVFSKERGFYENVFDLSITTDADETIKYTLDGSDPRFSPSVLISPSPLKLTINPEDTTNRYLAPAVVVRAAACKDDTLYSQVETQTFLYINKVVELSPEGVKPGHLCYL